MTEARRAGPARVRELAEEGFGRNAIARELGVSRRAVDEAAREAGITWDRSRTRKATAALVADAQHELSALFSETASVAARRLLDELSSEKPDPQLIRALASAADLPAGKLLTIADRLPENDDHSEFDSLIARFSAAVEMAYERDIDVENLPYDELEAGRDQGINDPKTCAS